MLVNVLQLTHCLYMKSIAAQIALNNHTQVVFICAVFEQFQRPAPAFVVEFIEMLIVGDDAVRRA